MPHLMSGYALGGVGREVVIHCKVLFSHAPVSYSKLVYPYLLMVGRCFAEIVRIHALPAKLQRLLDFEFFPQISDSIYLGFQQFRVAVERLASVQLYSLVGSVLVQFGEFR